MTNNIPIITRAEFFHLKRNSAGETNVKPREYSSVSIRLGGSAAFTRNEKTLTSHTGMMTYMPCGISYHTRVSADSQIIVCHFYTAENSPLLFDEPIVIKPSDPTRIQELFERAQKHFSTEGCDILCMSYVFELLDEANRAILKSDPMPYARMLKCKKYLDENIFNAELRVSELAEMFGTSEVYFRNEFKKFYRSSPLKYIKDRRMEKARQLLTTGIYSVTEVAMRTGFDSVSYFSSEFSRLNGYPPNVYLNRQKDREI